MRPIVSYDDISLPYQPPDEGPQTTTNSSPLPRRPKKRKNNNSHNSGGVYDQQAAPRPDPTVQVDEQEVYDGDLESRDLTHDEIWDDSALIEAWNAAAEEYKTYHGPEKDWKKEPVHKSPLWYNIPPDPQKFKQKSVINGAAKSAQPDASSAIDTENSKPMDFDAFIPTHDPSLGLPNGNMPSMDDPMNQGIIAPSGPLVSPDEAFSKALGAMYWAGYWTAAYHYSRQQSTQQSMVDEVAVEEEEEAEGDFVSAQR
ncbi:hypothetical protein PC9H_004175 [Pleurotus ostreatus]|uniref:Survival Motor Neuron Gemin2-binding domain-containing protein n=1 Tax=Pleurotus ostreatus TaxID=5322 RepID=A0A8H7A3P6_PLEOS|nr:uncharacterized protein PC9H_004175 [Pleurotus ostreatus]KAF7437336.1 hypothetical protein PC9H_004175 [Pleurotus ostreatus]